MRNSITGYSNLRKIAEGGRGAVYSGIERSRHRKVAIKKLPYRHLDNSLTIKGFENDAVILTSLYHDSIIRTYDYGESDEALYIAMEYIDGPDLATLLSWPDFHRDIGLIAVFQALKGLHFAHQKGVVHCDIKPSNILISQNGQAKLSDFGLSLTKAYSTHWEDKKNDSATPLYLPPEQVKMVEQSGIVHGAWAETEAIIYADMSSKQEHRAWEKGIQWDIWSVGVLLYRVCSGTFPFSGKTLPELLHAIVGIKERNIQELVPDLPPYLAQAITACLEKETDKRSASLEPVLTAFHRYFSRMNMEECEKAVRRYIRKNIPPVFKEKEKSTHRKPDESCTRTMLQSLSTVRDRLFSRDETSAFPGSERMIVPQLGVGDPDERFVPGRDTKKIADTKPHHSRLVLKGLSIGILLIVISGIAYFWFAYRRADAVAMKDNALVSAEKIDLERNKLYLLSDTIQTEQAGKNSRLFFKESKNGLASAPLERMGTSKNRNAVEQNPQKTIEQNSPIKKQVAQSSRESSGTRKGILKLILNPAEAMVFLNGKAVSRNGLLAGASLSAGTYEVLVKHHGYESYTSTLQVEDGETELVSIALQPLSKGNGQLHVYSYPWGDLYIDGDLAGTTPTQFPVSLVEGEHSVMIKRDGYQPYMENVLVEKEKVTRLQITLNKIE